MLPQSVLLLLICFTASSQGVASDSEPSGMECHTKYLIFQYGKVASSTLMAALQEEAPDLNAKFFQNIVTGRPTLPAACTRMPEIVHTHQPEGAMHVLWCCPDVQIITMSRRLENRELSAFIENFYRLQFVHRDIKTWQEWLAFFKQSPYKLPLSVSMNLKESPNYWTAEYRDMVSGTGVCFFFSRLADMVGLPSHKIPLNRGNWSCLRKGDYGIKYNLMVMRFEDVDHWVPMLESCLGLKFPERKLNTQNSIRMKSNHGKLHKFVRWMKQNVNWSKAEIDLYRQCDTTQFYPD